MTPFWIINFLKKDSCESFFNAYWRACQNTQSEEKPIKFFHITDGKADDLTKEMLNEIAFNRLARATDKEEKLIPAFTSNQGNEVNVIFIGDITQDKTIERFHTWAAYLQQQRMKDVSRSWFSIRKVTIYGILLRPENTSVDDDVLDARIRGFLNELNTLEGMDENHRPFERVLFIQSPIKQEDRDAAELSASLAAYHITRTDGQCFGNAEKLYYDTNATAVFFETDVQKEIDAYNLSSIILKDMTDSEDESFLNTKEAREFVDENQTIYIDPLMPSNMAGSFIVGTPNPPKIDFVSPYPLNIVNVGKMWNGYSDKYDNMDEAIRVFDKDARDYKNDFYEILSNNQHQFRKEWCQDLQKLVFQMFCETSNRQRFRHIGIQQSLRVLDCLKTKIKEVFKGEKDEPVHAFNIREELIHAAESARRNKLTSMRLLDMLKDELKQLPTVKKKLLASLCASGVLVVGLSVLFSPILLVALLLIVLLGGFVLVSKIRSIESLKDQYVGMCMLEIRQELDEKISEYVDNTQKQIMNYLQWLRKEKLIWLQENLSVLAVPNLQLRANKSFQPILGLPTSSKPLFASKDIELNMDGYSLEPGSFGHHPIIANVLPSQIYSVENGAKLDIFKLVDDHKNTVQHLVQELMYCREDIVGGKEKSANFQKHKSSKHGRSMLLLLDVSGSMSPDMDNLKSYVKDLENVGDIEWIAFDDKIVASSRNMEVYELSSGGGTCYIPAVKEATEWVMSNDYDDIVLLSDGGPFESVEDIVRAAVALDQPLNTIAVGSGAAEDVLIEIAIRTGGQEVSVDSFEDIRKEDTWNNEILPKMELLDSGNYSFGELMKHTQVTACANALRKFALECLEKDSLSIPKLFTDYLNEKGFDEWLFVSSQFNTPAQGVNPKDCIYQFATADEKEMEKMEDSLRKHCKDNEMKLLVSKNEPSMIVTLMPIRPLERISDMQWAASMKNGDKSINDMDSLKKLMQKEDVCMNIYDEPIN